MGKLIITTKFFLFLNIALNAQEYKLYEDAIFVHEGDTLNYRFLKPSNYDPSKQYPVHCFYMVLEKEVMTTILN